MTPTGAYTKGRIFVSCKREAHYSRELTLDQHALCYVMAGTLEITHADQVYRFGAGTTVLFPRNQLGRLAKFPAAGEPFRSISILFPEDLIRRFYASRPENPAQGLRRTDIALGPHPLLESLFSSLVPYFGMYDELPPELAELKIMETLTVLDACSADVRPLLSSFHEPGKLDLADFMEQNYRFNLPLEKFAYLTGRSLSSFKADFQKLYGTTPGRWLTRKRLDYAHYQIAVGKRKPLDVLIDSGFENLSHFSSAFKRQFGYSPRAVQA